MSWILFNRGLIIFILLLFLIAFIGCRTNKLEDAEIKAQEDTSDTEKTMDQSITNEDHSQKDLVETESETEYSDDVPVGPDSLDKDDASDIEKLFVLGRCEYYGFSGEAQIINIDIINQEEIEIVFNFLLKNPDDKSSYRFPNFPDNEYRRKIYISMTDSVRIIAETSKVQINNIEFQPGDILECIRLEITKGTCTPVIFFLPEIEKQNK